MRITIAHVSVTQVWHCKPKVFLTKALHSSPFYLERPHGTVAKRFGCFVALTKIFPK
jgi:hypothetical protein